MLVSAGSDGKVRFFDADGEEFGMPFRYAHGRSRTAVGLAFSRDGNRLALAEDDGRFYIWTTDWFRIACDRLMNDPGFKKGYYPYAVSRIASVCK